MRFHKLCLQLFRKYRNKTQCYKQILSIDRRPSQPSLCKFQADQTSSICRNIMLPVNRKYCIQFTHLFCEFAPFLLPLLAIWKLSSLDLPNTEFRLLNFLLFGFILLGPELFCISSQLIEMQETWCRLTQNDRQA